MKTFHWKPKIEAQIIQKHIVEKLKENSEFYSLSVFNQGLIGIAYVLYIQICGTPIFVYKML